MERAIAPQLIAWYEANKRDLPWRDTRNPYLIWISEIILQQTRVAQGYDYYLRFIERFPTVEALAAAPQEEVLRLWQGLGYYSRARNLHAAACDVMHRFAGEFPTRYDDVRSLSGIGAYTAAAICSFAYHQPHAVVDGNVYRVLARLFDEATPIDTTAGNKLFAALAQELLDTQRPHLHNQAMMELGATCCTPLSPRCDSCPLQSKCLAWANNSVTERPIKQGKVKVVPRYFNYLYVVCKGNTLLEQRSAKDIWRGLYQFPLLETPHAVSWEELQQLPDFATLFPPNSNYALVATPFEKRHLLSHRTIHARFYTIRVEQLSELLKSYQQVALGDVHNYAVSRLTELFLEQNEAV